QVVNETHLTGSDLFKETQKRVRWHYQWAVIHDFLPRIVGQDMVDKVFPTRPRDVITARGVKTISVRQPELMFYRPVKNAFMPVEFSAAAYRFGHSMIRPIYR